jgi:putative protease
MRGLEKELRQLEINKAAMPDRTRGRPKRATVKRVRSRRSLIEMTVSRSSRKQKTVGEIAYWLSRRSLEAVSKKEARTCWWWLPPVVWPEKEAELITFIDQARQKGGRRFVLNVPWQRVFVNNGKGLTLWAGPFCNLANPQSITQLKKMGFSGVIISPELAREDYHELVSQSSLPLGVIVTGMWPLCISRTVAPELTLNRAFRSPKGEEAWVRRYGSDYWVYPNWKLDLEPFRETLIKAGFQLLVRMEEPVPKGIVLKRRQGLWNWRVGLK